MSIVKGKVLLCKARTQGELESGENSYAGVLESTGFACTRLSVLRFEFINLDELRRLILTPNSYSGLILTSPRSAEAVALALGDGNAESKSAFDKIWKELPVYCVGAATDKVAREILSLEDCRGSETGNAKELAEFIVKEIKAKGDIVDVNPLLYPCSIIARDSLASLLKAAGISLRKLSVYQTLPVETLDSNLKEILGDSPPEYIVFFSPSAVKYVKNAIVQNGHEQFFKQLKHVAIGPVTEQAILDAGLEVYATSKQPEPLSLSNALRKKLTESS